MSETVFSRLVTCCWSLMDSAETQSDDRLKEIEEKLLDRRVPISDRVLILEKVTTLPGGIDAKFATKLLAIYRSLYADYVVSLASTTDTKSDGGATVSITLTAPSMAGLDDITRRVTPSVADGLASATAKLVELTRAFFPSTVVTPAPACDSKHTPPTTTAAAESKKVQASTEDPPAGVMPLFVGDPPRRQVSIHWKYGTKTVVMPMFAGDKYGDALRHIAAMLNRPYESLKLESNLSTPICLVNTIHNDDNVIVCDNVTAPTTSTASAASVPAESKKPPSPPANPRRQVYIRWKYHARTGVMPMFVGDKYGDALRHIAAELSRPYDSLRLELPNFLTPIFLTSTIYVDDNVIVRDNGTDPSDDSNHASPVTAASSGAKKVPLHSSPPIVSPRDHHLLGFVQVLSVYWKYPKQDKGGSCLMSIGAMYGDVLIQIAHELNRLSENLRLTDIYSKTMRLSDPVRDGDGVIVVDR